MRLLGWTSIALVYANDKTLFKWDVGNVDQEFCNSTFNSYQKQLDFDIRSGQRFKITKEDASQVILIIYFKPSWKLWWYLKSTPVEILRKLVPSQILFSIWKKKSEKLQFGLGNTKIRSKESVLKKAVTKVRSKSPAGEWALESRTKNTVKKWFKILIYIIFFKLIRILDNQIFFPQTNKMSLLFSAYQNFDDHEILLS